MSKGVDEQDSPNHRQCGSDCTVLTATGLVNGEWQILTPYRIETLEPIDKKFAHVITSARRRSCSRRYNTLAVRVCDIYLVSSTHLQVIPRNRFWRAMAQKTRFHAKKCLLGVKKVEINTEPHFMPPKVKFCPKSGLNNGERSGVNDP